MAAPALAAVTGGTGFLGRWIVRGLSDAGWRVRMLVRRDPIHPHLAGVDPEIVLGSLADGRALHRLVQGASLIVHAAGLVKALRRKDFFTVNAEGTAALARAAVAAAPSARLVMISSLAAREPSLSAYAASKAAGEAVLARFGPTDRVVLRPAAIYGPGDCEWLPIFRAAGRRFFPIAARPDARV
jgi:nucleoside-diphosphate-sugar epimerase